MDPLSAALASLPGPLTRAAVEAAPGLDPGLLAGVPAALADTFVAVRPAYLAPPTARSAVPAARILRAAGWTPSRVADGTEFRHRSTVVLLGAPDTARTVDALVAGGPSWQARLSSRTPDEVLAHAAAALVEYAEEGPGTADLGAALAGLAEAGWDGARRRDAAVLATAPDGLAELRWGPDQDTGEASLRILAGAGGDYWDAELGGAACPDLLVESLLASLASPAPARRRLREVPVGLYDHLDVTPEATRAGAAVRTSTGPPAAASAAPPGTPILSSPAPAANHPARRPR
ncbi:hypothetical protein [Kitasatospora sp. NPDC057015]|uniref:hypothetical protein n=1 Tax=Kitasatospora sp. NPDC057015 TaxID=3346001 RepID=UPI00362B0EC0